MELYIFGYYSHYSVTFRLLGPNYQGKGIGRHMIEEIETWLLQEKEGKPTMMVYLMAAEGKEGFYEQFGFKCRPGEGHMGAGMTKWME